jgi:putative MATE family efflux protein
MSQEISSSPQPMRLFSDSSNFAEQKKLNKDIFLLAMPVFVGQGINSLTGFISRVIIAELGDKAFNAINIGSMVFGLIITVVAAVAVGTTALVAQNWGLGNKKRAGEILQQSLIYGFVISLLIVIIGLPIRGFLFSLLGTDSETTAMGSEFMFWLLVGIPFLTPGFFLASGLRGAGDTKTPMYAGLVVALFTLLFSYGLILGRLGMPRLEVKGAALAVVIAFAAFTLVLAVVMAFKRTVLLLPSKGWRPDLRTGLSIMKIGLPSATEWILIQLGILIYVSVVAYYGEKALAGFFAGLLILNLTHAITMGFQTATTTIVGQAIGAKDYGRAETALRVSVYLGFTFLGAMAILFLLVMTPGVFSALFKELDPESIYYARRYLVLLAMMMPLMGISFSVAGGLRGAGDTINPLIASAVGVYGGRILFALAVYHIFHPPVYVIWCSMFPDLVIRLFIMAIRLKSGKWKTIKVNL